MAGHGSWVRDAVLFTSVQQLGYRLAEGYREIPGLKHPAAAVLKRFGQAQSVDEARRGLLGALRCASAMRSDSEPGRHPRWQVLAGDGRVQISNVRTRSYCSAADIRVTRDLFRAGQLLNLEVLDPIILGQFGPSSLRALGHLYK
ncbi:MAG: hypothetical protein IT580_23860 [Verrucomicrobiales bacterium]|nr:hypothetical protein [Verrucomicrobiales bacterium]